MHKGYGSAAYAKVQRVGGNPRETEARALLEANRRLGLVQSPDSPWRSVEQALAFNLRLWNIFAQDFARLDSPLPPDLRANLDYLFRFINKQTARILQKREPGKIPSLMNINRELALGLSTRPATPE